MGGSSAFSWFLRGDPKKGGRNLGERGEGSQQEEELGLTEQLRELVRSFTVDTFKEFRLPTTQQTGDDPSTSGDSRLMDHKYNSNIQKDLTVWQERHALRILSSVKELSELRYVLCPRHLKDKDFWRIYFHLVKNYVAPYEIRAIQKVKLKAMAQEAEKRLDSGAVEVEMMSAKKVECMPTRQP